jgi:DNA-binding MarR family transcriptional regulator
MLIPPQVLDEEVSFKLYTLNRLIQQAYQAYLSPLQITYPQYLVMKILLEEDHVPVNVISTRLMLESNTVTPLLQRMERQGLLVREQKCEDHRQRIISLTSLGMDMRHDIGQVSALVAESLSDQRMDCAMATNLTTMLNEVIRLIR